MKEYFTDYLSHDSLYKLNRQKSLAGWSEKEEDYKEIHGLIADFISKAHLPPTAKGLDLGCGAGNNAVWVAKQGFRMSGIDISPTAIDWANEVMVRENLDINFELGSAVTLDKFEDNSFDFIIDSACLHCIIGTDREILFKNVVRTLKNGGYFLIMTMALPYPVEMETNFDKSTNCLMRNGKHVRYFGHKEDILQEITNCGLEIIEYNYSDSEGNGFLTAIAKTKKIQ